jgi:hypothetical protein
MRKRTSGKKIGMAASQVITLLVATFAFAFLIGQISLVSASSGSPCTPATITKDCGMGYVCTNGLCVQGNPTDNNNQPVWVDSSGASVTLVQNGNSCITHDSAGNTVSGDSVCASGYCSGTTNLCQDAPSTQQAQQPPSTTQGQHASNGAASGTPGTGSENPNQGGTSGGGDYAGYSTYEDCMKYLGSDYACSHNGGSNYGSTSSSSTDNNPQNQNSQQGGITWDTAGKAALTVGASIAQGGAWAAGVYAFTQFLKQAIGLKPGDPAYVWYTGAQFVATGFVFGMTALPGAITAVFGEAATAALGGAFGLGLIGAAVALVLFTILYKDTKQDTVVVTCIPWQAPVGGADCEKCGQNGLPCTNYQCTHLGQACQLLNTQGSGKPVCVWVDKGDITPPTMTFLDVLPSGYTSTPLTATAPGDTGVLVQSSQDGGLIPPFSTLSLGITTDKVSQCKVDGVRGDNFTDMAYNMVGGIDGTEGLWGYNHTINLPVLQPTNNGAGVQKSGQYDLYIRCENANGYATPEAFDFQFVVDTTPDKTAPQIMGTSILNGGPVPYGTTSTSVNVYTNEPVPSIGGCKWTHNSGYGYSDMENNMTCSNAMNTMGTYSGTYTCTANLDGIKNSVENDFYFACQDLSGNVDTQNYQYSLIGTQPLVINSATPANGTTIKDSTQSIKVTLNVQTSAGQSQGQATCYYDPSTDPSGYKMFSNTNSYQSSQDLWLTSGAYNYNIKCVDLGGNAAYTSVNFNVQTDTQAPNVVRASHDGANLNIQTDEQATCVYDIVDCTYPFDGGTSMSSGDGLTFSTAWVAGRTYYIKCQDSFGNQPAPNSCSIILSPSSV